MARRARGAPAIASVTWRDGVHLTGTPIWCDARRRRDVCFVSSADRVGKAGHGQLIGSPLTLALLGAGGGGHLGVPRHKRFTLGTVRLELIASGRGPGAMALYVDITGKTILYAGAIRTEQAHGIDGAEVRACDALVVAAPSAEAKVEPLERAIDRVLEQSRSELVAGRRPVIVVETALDGLEVATALANAGIAVAGGRGIREAAQRANSMDAVAQANALQIASPGKEPRATVWLARESTAKLGAHTAIPSWPNTASREQLLAWIESANAREVFVTGTCAEDIVAAVGDRARMLGPPHQMTLFGAL